MTWNTEKQRAYQKQWNANPVNKAKKRLYDQTRRPKDRKKKEWALLKGMLFEIADQRCACCGETERAFLTLDHVHNNGKEERSHKDSKAIYRRAVKEWASGEYQVLCWNCQLGKYRNNGVCPHKSKKQTGSSGESEPVEAGSSPPESHISPRQSGATRL